MRAVVPTRSASSTAAAHVVDPATLGDHVGGKLGRQAGAAAVHRSDHDAHLAGAAPGGLPRLGQPGELGVPADHRALRAQCCWQSRPVTGDDQFGVLVEYLPLEGAQFRAGVEAERFRQRPPRPLEGDEGVVLPAGGVQRAHEERPRPLAAGLLGDEALQLRDRRPGRPVGELGLGEILDRTQTQLVEAHGFGDRELGVGELGVGRATPQPERLAEQIVRRGVGASRQLPPAVGDQPLEARRVHGGGIDSEPVTTGNRLDQLTVDLTQRTPKPDHVGLDRLAGGRRRLVSPQGVDDGIARNHPPRPAGEQRQEAAPARAGDVHLATDPSTVSGPSTETRTTSRSTVGVPSPPSSRASRAIYLDQSEPRLQLGVTLAKGQRTRGW